MSNLSSPQRPNPVAGPPSSRSPRRPRSAWQMFVLPRPLPQQATISPAKSNSSAQHFWRSDASHASVQPPHYTLSWTEFVGLNANGAPRIALAAQPAPEPVEPPSVRFAELLAEAAHDMRAPITTAQQILASILQRSRCGKSLDAKDIELLEGARLRLEQAGRWSEDILAERHLTQRIISNIRRRFYPDQWRKELQPLLESIAAESNVQIEWVGWDRSLPRMYLDPNLLSRVIMNLVTNAIQASRSGGQVSVRVAWQTNVTQRLLVAIEDQGVGLAAQLMRQVNSSKPWPERAAGTPLAGLGLRTAKTLVESMGGSISVQHGPQGGTLFRLALPVDDLRSLIRSWIVQNAATAGPYQRARLSMHSVRASGMNNELVDRQLQRAASTKEFVYRVATDHWLWLSLADSTHSHGAEDIHSLSRRLSESGSRTHAAASCRAEMFYSLGDLPFANLHAADDQAPRLAYLTQLVCTQVQRQLNGRVPPIDPAAFTSDSKILPSPVTAAASPNEVAAVDPAEKTISDIARQWRVIHSKLEQLHKPHFRS